MNDHPLRQWLLLLRGFHRRTGAGFSRVDPLPPKPSRYVVDTASILSPQLVAALNQRLEGFERQTSNQVLVATFPRIPDGYALEDFTQRTAEAWGVGQSKEDNGVVLFVFPNDRVTRIEVGYGLEGALPDIITKRIIENELLPVFSSGRLQRWNQPRCERDPSGHSRRISRLRPDQRRSRRRADRQLARVSVIYSRSAHDSRRQSERCTTWDFLRPPRTTNSLDSANWGRLDRWPWRWPWGRSFGGGGFSGGGGSFGGGGASGRW